MYKIDVLKTIRLKLENIFFHCQLQIYKLINKLIITQSNQVISKLSL